MIDDDRDRILVLYQGKIVASFPDDLTSILYMAMQDGYKNKSSSRRRYLQLKGESRCQGH